MSNSDDFVAAYDLFSKSYCDPVEILFMMAADNGLDPSHRITAAKDLVAYRFPKLKSVDITAGEGVKGLTFVMGPQINVDKMAVLGAREEFGQFYDDSMRLIQ